MLMDGYGSDMFICSMDMTKAFDLVKHSVLFDKLLSTNIPKVFIRLLFFTYYNQRAFVKWNDESSTLFPMHNGVRQGAILSSVLYCVYMNDLYIILRRSGYGCWINGVYHGCFGYSDDNITV